MKGFCRIIESICFFCSIQEESWNQIQLRGWIQPEYNKEGEWLVFIHLHTKETKHTWVLRAKLMDVVLNSGENNKKAPDHIKESEGAGSQQAERLHQTVRHHLNQIFTTPPSLLWRVCDTNVCVWIQIEQETYGDACQEHDGPFHGDGTHPPRHATLRPEVNVGGQLSW